MSNNKQSSVDFLIKSFQGAYGDKVTNIVSDLFEQAKAMHKEEHSNTWDESLDNYKKRGENDMRHWVDFDYYYNETFGGEQ